MTNDVEADEAMDNPSPVKQPEDRSQFPIHYMATMTWKKVEPDVISGDEFGEAMALVAMYDTRGSVLKILFPNLVRESLPSSRSAESGTWTEVPGFYHIHGQHCLYDTVTWQKQSQQQSTAINHNPLDIVTWQQQVVKGTN